MGFRLGTLLRAVFSTKNAVSLLVGCGAPVLLGFQPSGKATALGFVVARFLYARAEQRVPFSGRKHLIIFPGVIEAVLGTTMFRKFLMEQEVKHTVLDPKHKDVKLVEDIARRLVEVVKQQPGGGYQKHTRHFDWEVAVIRDPTENAFVFPGGKIVFYTGLLDLLRRDRDLVAMVMAHEVSHALARHSSERIGLGLVLSLLLQLAVAGAGSNAAGSSSGGQQQRRRQPVYTRHPHSMRLAAGDDDVANAAAAADDHSIRDDIAAAAQAMLSNPEAVAAGYTDAARSGRPASHAPAAAVDDVSPAWLSEKLLQSMSAIFLELPFSRRAETEADMIGLKLVILAGFDPSRAGETFRLLAKATDRGRHSGSESLIASLGCTHPNSQHRAELLEAELELTRQSGDKGTQQVLSKLNYWAL